MELYRTWGFRLDDTPFQYLNSPKEMAASAGSAPLLLLAGIFVALLASGWGLYKLVVGPLKPLPSWFGRRRAALASLLYVALLVVPLRGGIQQIPVNQSDVYFSRMAFANHAAVNAPWNLMSALILRKSEQPTKPFMADRTAQQLVAAIYPLAVGAPNRPDSTVSYLAETRPNVLFIILESFTSKLVGSMGGQRGVTPTLDSLARTGIAFTNIYAAGDRSQKGLVSLLSGYPNQPTTSIIKFPRKTEKLPHLSRQLATAGYRSRYYYGGELAFANMGSYLQTAGFEHIIERSDFSLAEQNSKWGAHDGALFARVLTDLKQQPQPFFVTAFTLSSHEPFEVPMTPKFPGTTESDLFRSSVYYTDYTLGRFLKEAKKQPWYAHTLLVVVADHGHHLPGNSSNQSPNKFKIPFILAGGALRPEARGKVVKTIGSQTDVAATLLRQLNLPASDFQWSRDLLARNPVPFAFYCFNNGFGAVSPAGVVTFDNVSRQIDSVGVKVSDAQIQLGKAMQQVSLDDFARK
ncbi:LTA synthase family protein [Hymenobacter sp. BT683]|uniref:LTA synthase family protein n=1 Tax=Hymenobacter jeongseonensis TaxID=2791027 RepID=A0ABS0IMM9_9BACT|nr:LTA synthase family protein [Hymenobacter jeongseonensis]MBF9239593.1 LTA synthase family protein [Hymenobacter jeongseonensis]